MSRLTIIEEARIDFAAAEDAMNQADTNVNIANNKLQIAISEMQKAVDLQNRSIDRQNKARSAYRHALVRFLQSVANGAENA